MAKAWEVSKAIRWAMAKIKFLNRRGVCVCVCVVCVSLFGKD